MRVEQHVHQADPALVKIPFFFSRVHPAMSLPLRAGPGALCGLILARLPAISPLVSVIGSQTGPTCLVCPHESLCQTYCRAGLAHWRRRQYLWVGSVVS